MPWEKERQLRIIRAVGAGALRQAKQPAVAVAPNTKTDPYVETAGRLGLPPPEGPGANVNARRWGEYTQQYWAYRGYVGQLYFLPLLLTHGKQKLHATQTLVALALYQADHGKPPAQLAALVPAYLPALPVDPATAPASSRTTDEPGD